MYFQSMMLWYLVRLVDGYNECLIVNHNNVIYCHYHFENHQHDFHCYDNQMLMYDQNIDPYWNLMMNQCDCCLMMNYNFLMKLQLHAYNHHGYFHCFYMNLFCSHHDSLRNIHHHVLDSRQDAS